MGGLGFDISKSQLSFSTHSIIIYNTHRRATLLLCCGIYFPFCSIMRMRSLSKATQEGSEQRLQGSGEECTWTWMDTVEWADSHYCAFAEHMATQVISAVVSCFALTPPPHPSPQTLPYKVKWKHKEVMQGDWMSSPRRRNSCSDPRGPVKGAGPP